MKKRILPLACLASMGLSATASADDASRDKWQWSPGVAVGTEEVWRGQSLTNGKPSIVGEAKLIYDHSIYTGIWAGNLDLGPHTDTSAEIDYFLGWTKSIGRVRVDVGYLYRQRPSSTKSLDFQEVTTSASYDFGIARVGAGTYYSWDYFQGGHSFYSFTNLRVPVGKVHGLQFVALASAGHYHFSNCAIGDYNDAELRLVAVHNSWEYSIGYSDTDVDPARSGLLTRNAAGSRWRAQVLVMF